MHVESKLFSLLNNRLTRMVTRFLRFRLRLKHPYFSHRKMTIQINRKERIETEQEVRKRISYTRDYGEVKKRDGKLQLVGVGKRINRSVYLDMRKR